MGLDGRGVTRAMSLSPGQWGALEMDLYEEGMAYYQWCCLPTFDHDLPEKESVSYSSVKRMMAAIGYI